MPNNDSKRAYNVRYVAEKKKGYTIKLNREYDAEYIELLDSIDNRAALLRRALEIYAAENKLPVPKRTKPESE